ncbi:MAG: hypothetical protein J6I62_07465, partial [Selenomonadaceae bacterium]|nr:hypothetical protein [Selenomonadaceae bacterium]
MSESIYTDERTTVKYWAERFHASEKELWYESEVSAANKRIRKKTKTLIDLAKFPNKLRSDEAQEMILAAQQFLCNRKTIGEYYDSDSSPITESDFKFAKENCNLEGLKKFVTTRFALTIRRDNLR